MQIWLSDANEQRDDGGIEAGMMNVGDIDSEVNVMPVFSASEVDFLDIGYSYVRHVEPVFSRKRNEHVESYSAIKIADLSEDQT